MLYFLLLFLVSLLNANPTGIEINNCLPASGKNEELIARNGAEQKRLTDREVLARLILSESLSTGYFKNLCQAPSAEKLMQSIGWGILNRVKQERKKDPYFETIFKPNQFRTSFSGKRKNPFAEVFLCPLKAEQYLRSSLKPEVRAYELAVDTANSLVTTFQAQGVPSPFSRVTHFFYPGSEFFGEIRPNWAPNPVATRNKGYLEIFQTERPCVEFYSLR